jgi:hypothetical protein
MTEFYHFAAESPFLTFFLLLLVCLAVTESLKWLAYAIRGSPLPKDEDEEDE